MKNQNGFSMISLVVTLGIILIAVILIFEYSGFLDKDKAGEAISNEIGLHKARQARTISDMKEIAKANSLYYTEKGSYAPSLDELAIGGYLRVVPRRDRWGNAFEYNGVGSTFTLISYGSDGRHGPEPPNPWIEGSHESDITMYDGDLTQAPKRR